MTLVHCLSSHRCRPTSGHTRSTQRPRAIRRARWSAARRTGWCEALTPWWNPTAPAGPSPMLPIPKKASKQPCKLRPARRAFPSRTPFQTLRRIPSMLPRRNSKAILFLSTMAATGTWDTCSRLITGNNSLVTKDHSQTYSNSNSSTDSVNKN